MKLKPSHGEQRYFLQHESTRRGECRQRIEQVAAELEAQQAIADTLKVDNTALVERIRSLGFDGDSARVLDLLPLIQVSWSDGKVQREERAAILGILESRGIEPKSEASLLIQTLLEKEPSEAYWKATNRVLRELLGASADVAQQATIVDLCLKVAEASTGLLGFGKVSEDERYLMQQIADTLGPEAQSRYRQRMVRK